MQQWNKTPCVSQVFVLQPCLVILSIYSFSVEFPEHFQRQDTFRYHDRRITYTAVEDFIHILLKVRSKWTRQCVSNITPFMKLNWKHSLRYLYRHSIKLSHHCNILSRTVYFVGHYTPNVCSAMVEVSDKADTLLRVLTQLIGSSHTHLKGFIRPPRCLLLTSLLSGSVWLKMAHKHTRAHTRTCTRTNWQMECQSAEAAGIHR